MLRIAVLGGVNLSQLIILRSNRRDNGTLERSGCDNHALGLRPDGTTEEWQRPEPEPESDDDYGDYDDSDEESDGDDI